MSSITSPARPPQPPTDPTRHSSAKVVCVAAIAGKGILGLALMPLTPSLLGTHPVLLEALRGTTSAMATAGAFARVGQAPLPLVLLAPIPTLFFVIPFFWWAGRLWGPAAAATLTGGHPKAQRWADRISTRFSRFGGAVLVAAFFLPIPSGLIYAAAGWTGMTLRRFVLFSLLGVLLWIGLIVGLGYAVGRPAVQVAKGISHYGLILTIALVLLAVVVGVLRVRRAANADAARAARATQ